MLINNEDEYRESLKRASKIFDLPEEIDPASPEGKAFSELISAICDYEERTSGDEVRKTKLSKESSQRLLRHMAEDPPNPLARESLERGRELLKRMGKPR